jgi:Amt family ammonium transporter
MLGAILTGIFADPAVNEAAGLLYGNPGQLLIQFIAVAVTVLYTAIVTIIIFLFVKVFIGIRVNVEHEITGLDESQHGEKAYSL